MACYRVLFAVLLSTAFGFFNASKASIPGAPLKGIVLFSAREPVSLHFETGISPECASPPALRTRFPVSAGDEPPAIVPNPFLLPSAGQQTSGSFPGGHAFPCHDALSVYGVFATPR